MGSSPGGIKPKTIKMVFVAPPLSMHHKRTRRKQVGSQSGRVLGTRGKQVGSQSGRVLETRGKQVGSQSGACPREVACLFIDCSFSKYIF